MKQSWIALVLAVALTATGCATKKYVQGQVSAAEQRVEQHVEEVEGQVEQNQTRLTEQGSRLDEQARKLGEASSTAKDAYDRAIAAGKLAEGKFLYETTFTADQIRFGSDKAEIAGDTASALDEFAAKVKSENKNVYIEIQGHTDATGSEAYNLKLGQERAEEVRLYLNRKHGFALHRMSVISYGESAPTVDNKTRDGRSQNRRVVLVVLH